MSFVLEHVFWVTVLSALAAMFCYLFRPAPQTRYVIWLLLLLKLLLAPILLWPICVEDFGVIADSGPGDFESIDQVGNEIVPRTANGGSFVAGNETPLAHAEPARFNQLVNAWPANTLLILGGIWIAGIAVRLFLYSSRILKLFAQDSRAIEPTNSLVRDVARVAQLTGRQAPKIKIVRNIHSPAVMWFGQNYLLWPEFELDSFQPSTGQERRDLWLTHEFAHLKRYDQLLGWIETLALIVWWWLPVAYWVVREIQVSCEACCDAWVKRYLPNKVSRYAHLLIDSVSENKPTSIRHLYAGFNSHKSALKYRLTTLLETNANRRFAPLLSVCFGLVFLPHLSIYSTAKDLNQTDEWRAESVTDSQAKFESHMEYLVNHGGKWRANNPQFIAGGEQPKTFRYEFAWGTNKSIVKGKIIGEYENGIETTYSEMIVFWHPATKDMTLHQYGSSGEIGKGTTEHLSNGNERIVYAIVGRDGTRSDYEYLNVRQSSKCFVTYRKMKPANGNWQKLSELTWMRIVQK